MVDLPVVGYDPLNWLHRAQNYHNSFSGGMDVADYHVASDMELINHYMYGVAGPFIDLLLYVDLGVGWSLKPVGFEDEDTGLEAKALVEHEFMMRDFHATMMQFAAYYLILGRSCLIKTYDKGGGFYFDEKSRVTGLDVINPMTLNTESIRRVMIDATGTKMFIQRSRVGESCFSQDRVLYRTNDTLNKYSVYGVSSLQRCIDELRLISRFPRYREGLARKYANLHRIFEVNTEEFMRTSKGEAVLNDSREARSYLDGLADYCNQQEDKGSNMVVYDWINVKESSYAGKEVKLNDLELQTLRSIALKLDVPLDLLMYSQVVNRSVMEVLADVFVNKQKSGARNYVYTPIIEGIANELLLKSDLNEGYLKVEYNPFLSKNLVETAGIVRDLWPTGNVTVNEARDMLDLPPLND